VGFRDDIRFLVGALGHGLTAEQAMPMYQSALDDKQYAKQQRQEALTNLLTTGQELAGSVDDPQSFSQLMQMYGKGFGARPGQVSKVTNALSPGVASWDETDTLSFFDRHGETVKALIEGGVGARGVRERMRKVVQAEGGFTPEEWAAISPQFDKALEAAYLGAAGNTGKGSGYPTFIKNATLRAQHAVASPQEVEQRDSATQPPPAAEGTGVADSGPESGWDDLAAIAGAYSSRPALMPSRAGKLGGKILGQQGAARTLGQTFRATAQGGSGLSAPAAAAGVARGVLGTLTGAGVGSGVGENLGQRFRGAIGLDPNPNPGYQWYEFPNRVLSWFNPFG
jgi:hypothetical protein